ncbi:2-keto-4-pentenoate hydratase [Acidovorax sp. HMWF029]|uniref:2-keto-4-pentenoate hydratase n=1 Tax=Acidovorax sp. HMWF029 TaxID=2056863 RepID=UPI000D3D206A|nr:fumarylacetoacetate hydrolase family protein [Acidovorax sp. HMWF029]PTT16988.1 2-keto-4-pentenoate hydratase [Acidovorax sp. HMWF029]
MPDTAFDPQTSAAVLTMARQGRTPRPFDLPAALRPQDAAQAYAVQDAVVRERGEVAGWKVGSAAPDALPARAALTRDSVWVAQAPHAGQAAVHLPTAGFAVLGVEAELVYELGTDLPPRETPYSAAEVLAAMVSVRAAIEVCDTRFAAWGLQGEWSRLADQACHGALIVGFGVRDVAAVQPLSQAVTLSVNGAVAVQHATWGNPAGDPLRLLAWLANEGAHSLGGLRAGQWVTTGSCTGTVLVAPGTRVVADFPGLGRAELVLD